MVISPRYGYVVEVYRQLIGADGQPAGDVEKLYTDKYVAVQGELHYGTGSSTLPCRTAENNCQPLLTKT